MQADKTFNKRKKRIFFLITISIPFIFIITLEILLRIFNYGTDISLFSTINIRGTTYHVLNPTFGTRYFSSENIIPVQSTDYFLVPKPKGMYRIFCLGGSTVAGYPYWYNASFASFLRCRLQKIFPDQKIEVINLGMPAINSFVVLDMAKELLEYEPDLIIIYDGHNEFYGPLGVSSQVTFFGSRWLNMLYLNLLHSRLFLLMRDSYNSLLNLFHNNPEFNKSDLTLELLAKGQYIPYGSEIYNKVKQTFKSNVDDLIALCNSYNVHVILSTQVSNLRDQVPFVSKERSNLNSSLKTELQKHFKAGDLAGSEGKIELALNELNSAIEIDSQYASAHYGVARCLDILNQPKEAYTEYVKARDFDQLRFRTSSDFNQIILDVGKKSEVGVVDMEKIFAANSSDSLIGSNLILEYLHPNSYGQFLMAKGFASVMRKFGFIVDSEEWKNNDTIADSILWKERNVTQLDELIARRRTKYIISSWPFVQNEIPVPEVLRDDTLQNIAENVVEHKMGWGDAHLASIEYYTNRNDLLNLEQEYKVMFNFIPCDVGPYLNLANFYYEHKRYNEAHYVLLNSLTIEQTKFAFQTLGKIAEQLGDFQEAKRYFIKALNLK